MAMPSISGSASSSAATGPTQFGNVTQNSGFSQTTWWILGGVAALALGLFFYFRKPAK
jgi:LPXTG-motif cell wall-anchored protein